ncbi:MAG: hypothetical protein U9Q71_10090, partial [Pseudomonadota bacterium]|nr:hypothetical protein [Pseudomonadota bacterium]
TLFLLAVYSFAYFLFGKFEFTPTQRTAAAVLSALFVALHMGINVFAYIRYYGMAPTMLNFALFFTGIICITMLLEKDTPRWQWAAILAACTIAAMLIHNQEALYIVVLGTLMLAWNGIRTLLPKLRGYPAKYWPRITLRNGQILLLLSLFASAVLIEIWAYTHLERAPLLQEKVITVSAANAFLNRLPILNPGFQFIRVLTVWGLLVYLLFLLNFRRFAAHPYFVAGMALPLFTVFNPLFVDLFLRFDDSTTLWRLGYAIPLHFVAAWLVVYYTALLARSYGILAKGEAVIGLVLLFLLLLPVSLGDWQNAYARTTLAPVPETGDYRYWRDMIDRLNTLPQRETILTDSVTGYVVSALTGHRTFHYKFFPSREYKQHWHDLISADSTSLNKLGDWLLLVNMRDGAFSRTGELARHWPPDIMSVSRHYPPGLDQLIEAQPERFKLLWRENKIALYRMAVSEGQIPQSSPENTL